METGSSSAICVRDPVPEDEPVWRQLWAGYNAFYGATVPAEATDATWARILAPGSCLFARLGERDGAVVGFACAVLHPGTWSVEPVCYLEDLFADPGARGAGVGGALIRDLADLGRTCGWKRLYWHTRADNGVARRLYDRFTEADGFVRYTLVLR
ncbi:N-acetyltransferase family protein [Azospirillum argentinense]